MAAELHCGFPGLYHRVPGLYAFLPLWASSSIKKKKQLKLYFMTALVQEGILSSTGLCYNLAFGFKRN